MSSRPISDKQERRAVKSARRSLTPYIDLVHWIKQRQRVSTGTALAIIRMGALKVDSHTIGVKTVKDAMGSRKEIEPLVPASYRGRIDVVIPELQDGPR